MEESRMNQYRIKPGSKLNLAKVDPNDTGKYAANAEGKAKAERAIAAHLDDLQKLQPRLYASANQALLIILQAMDTGGKDGTIKNVMSGVNPLGCRVSSFKVPTSIELAHDFLWRVHHEVPPKGYIGIFNRSHYEDVLVTRVHGVVSDSLAVQRFKQINNFERLLVESGTAVLKFFLHISKDEQRARLQARIRDPEKRWKFHPSDLEERKLWSKYQSVYEDAIGATSTEHACWYVVPANRKWYRNLVVAETVVDTLEQMNLKPPPLPPGVDFERLKID
jgi:PPK2 family polyphosphate:nucleotide phosphotransferase